MQPGQPGRDKTTPGQQPGRDNQPGQKQPGRDNQQPNRDKNDRQSR